MRDEESNGAAVLWRQRLAVIAVDDPCLHAGDPFLMPPRTPHNATEVGGETGLMLSTYIVEVGPPLATFT